MEFGVIIGIIIACIYFRPFWYFVQIMFLLSPFGWIVLIPMFIYAYIKTISDYLLSMSIVYEDGAYDEKNGYAERMVIYKIQKAVIILASIAIVGACVAALVLFFTKDGMDLYLNIFD